MRCGYTFQLVLVVSCRWWLVTACNHNHNELVTVGMIFWQIYEMSEQNNWNYLHYNFLFRLLL